MKHSKVKSESPKMDTSVFKGKKEMTKSKKYSNLIEELAVRSVYNEQKKPGRKTATKTSCPCQKQNFILKVIERNKGNFDKPLKMKVI